MLKECILPSMVPSMLSLSLALMMILPGFDSLAVTPVLSSRVYSLMITSSSEIFKTKCYHQAHRKQQKHNPDVHSGSKLKYCQNQRPIATSHVFVNFLYCSQLKQSIFDYLMIFHPTLFSICLITLYPIEIGILCGCQHIIRKIEQTYTVMPQQ